MSKVKLELVTNHLSHNNNNNHLGTSNHTNNLLQEQHYQEHYSNNNHHYQHRVAQPATQTTDSNNNQNTTPNMNFKMAQANIISNNNQQQQQQQALPSAQQQQQQQQQQPQINGPKPRGRRKKIRTEPIRPICPQCEKQFSNQSALTKHKLTHSDERKFACLQCSKAFKRHDHLTGHMQTHSNRKPFNCTIQGCDKTYCDARSLRRHKENIHHIITPRDLNNSTNSTNSNQHNHHHHHHHHHHHNQEQYQQQNSNKSTSDLSIYDSLSDLNNNTGGSTLLNLDHQSITHNHDVNNLSPTTPTYQANMSSTSTSTDQLATTGAADSSSVFMSTATSNSSSSNATDQQQHQQLQPSQLYRRRIQRLHSDQGTYGATSCNGDQHDMRSSYLACNTTSTTTNNAHNVVSSPQQVPHTGNTHIQHHHLSNQYLNNTGHHHHHQQQHASYSADYACTQQFNFDLINVNMNGHHMGHAIRGGGSSALPLSADSVTDSGLDLNAHYEQLTPNHQQPPPPPQSRQQQQQSQAQQVQLTQPTQPQPQHIHQNLQPSHLLKRRIQRLHSDQGTYGASCDPSDSLANRGYLACNTAPIDSSSSHSLTTSQQQVPHTANGHHHDNNQYLVANHHQHQQHASYSADYASTQRFIFDSTNMTGHHMDHAISSSTIPLSADSVTDSGLDLNVHYEQLTPSSHGQQQTPTIITPQPEQQHQTSTNATTTTTQQLPAQPPPLQLQPLQAQQQQRYQQHHQQHISYSAGYANPRYFDFDFTTPQAVDGAPTTLATCGSLTIDRDISNNLMDEQHNSYVTYAAQDDALRSS